MPLTGTEKIMAATFKAEMQKEVAKNGGTAPDPKALDAMANALATTVIGHITKNAVVPLGIAVATSGGAGSTSGPGKIT